MLAIRLAPAYGPGRGAAFGPDLGSYTVKAYASEKAPDEHGNLRHHRVTLTPRSSDPTFQPLVFEDLAEGSLRIVAELVEVLA